MPAEGRQEAEWNGEAVLFGALDAAALIVRPPYGVSGGATIEGSFRDANL